MARVRWTPCPDCGGLTDHEVACSAVLVWQTAAELRRAEVARRAVRARLVAAIAVARGRRVPQAELARLIGRSKRSVQLMEEEAARLP